MISDYVSICSSSLTRCLVVLVFTSVAGHQAASADPPSDDDSDILEVVFDALKTNQEQLGSFTASYHVTNVDKTVDSPTTKIARALDGSGATMKYSVSPKTESDLSVTIGNSTALYEIFNSQTASTVEVVRHNEMPQSWEFFHTTSNTVEIMRVDDLPSRRPLLPQDQWMPRLGDKPVEYIASMLSRAQSKTIRLSDDGASAQIFVKSSTGDDKSFVGVSFSVLDNMLPVLAITGFDDEIETVTKLKYKKLKSGGLLAENVSVFYTSHKLMPGKDIFTIDLPQAYTQSVTHELVSHEGIERRYDVPLFEIDSGTIVKDPFHLGSYSGLNSQSDGGSSLVGSWALAINAGVIVLLVGLLAWRRKSAA
ncbi:MAG: hypothetical protein KDB27_23025 [Planctomycetales bacterium]|nr:hypothetical protein [Planctomycetales bacterium]